MNLSEIHTKIGLADAKIINYERLETTFIVHVKAWNEANVRISFSDVQLVCDLMSREISGFYVHNAKTELIEKAQRYAYDQPPQEYPYKHYVFLNTDDQPCLDVIADGMEVAVI
jgi:hypothetical protein